MKFEIKYLFLVLVVFAGCKSQLKKVGLCDDHSACKKEQDTCEKTRGAVFDYRTRICLKPYTDKDCRRLHGKDIWDGLQCAPASTPKNFFRYCISKNLSASLQQTIDQMLKPFGESSCQAVYAHYYGLTELDLSQSGISDVRPLVGLNQLEKLNLFRNKISNFNELLSLEKLSYLDLTHNSIGKLPMKLLQKNRSIKTLKLSNNPLENSKDLEKISHFRVSW